MKILGLLLLAAFVRSEPPNLCGSDVCHRYASCVGGGCVCDDGYTGDGKTCIGVNICAQGNDCHSDATCTYTGPGTYQCTCNEGFDGDGKSCSESGPGPAICKKTDIIFVLDRSSSIRPADYNLMRSFISSLAQKLKIGKRDKDGEIIGQGAIVTFSEVGTKRINLKESQVEGSFLEMVKAMPGPLPGGRTKTHRGLKVADEVVLTKSAGFREDDDDVARIFMVITDGKQTRESKRKGYIYVGEAMKPFFARDMNVFAVGVGLKDNSAKQQIRDMVEDPNNAILAENFMELTETVNNFIQRFCKVPSICGNADDCSSEASCADTAPGEYECTCPTGYNGNGKFCLVPPVCGSARDDCDPFFATCTDKGAGEYECKCVPGYTGDGRTCIPDKICDTPKDDCHEYATCTDLAPGEYKCECNLGYSGDGKSCIAISIGFETLSYNVREEDSRAIVEVSVKTGEITTPLTFNFNTQFGTAGASDFTEKSQRITFQPGQSGPIAVEIEIEDDTQIESTEAFQVTISDPSYTVGMGGPATVNILDNDEAVIGFTSSVVNVREDQTAVMEIGFTSGSASSPVTVRLATNAGTASDVDFVGKTVDVTFEAGETGPKRVQFEIVDDSMVESTEAFTVSLVSSSLSAVKVGEPSTVNILDNDEATIGFSKASYDVAEGVGKARVKVAFTAGEALVPVTVGFATTTGTAGEGDFVSKTTDVTFQPGETEKWIEIDITDDDLLEPTESFGVSLVSSSVEDVKLGSPSTVNILDNDVATIGFIRQTYDVPEDQKAKIAIGFLRGEATSPVTVRLATRAGTASSEDFVSKEVDVTFQPGETGPKEIEFDLVDDLLVEATESFNIEVVSSSNKVIELGRPSTVNILDNDEAVIGFASSTYDINEDGKAVVEVAFTSGQANVPVTVQLKTSPGTASNEDFVPKTVDVTFQPGETGPKQVEFEIVDDLLVENTESFQVSVVSSSVPAVKSGGPATVNIRDNDEAIVSFIEGSYDVREDENAVIEVEISSGTLTSPVTVRLTTEPLTAGKDDYVPQTVDITFEAGETGPKMMTIPIIDDNLVEPTEKFKVNLVSSSEPSVKLGEPTSVNILLKDNDDAVIGFSKRAYDVIESENARIEVGFSSGESSEPVTVTLETVPSTASANDDYVPQRVNVTLQPGERMKTVEFDIVDDTLLENTEEFKVAVVYSSVPAVTWGKPASVNIQDNDEVVVGFTRLQYDANENEKATVEVQIAAGQSAVPVTVWLQTSPGTAGSGDYSSDPVEITFQPGETGPKSIDIDLVDDEILEDTERFTVFLRPTTPRVKAGRPASVQILDNEVPPICNTPRDDCHRYATCTDDGPGEYSCKCNEGYTGDGKSCLAINVCGTDQDDCHGDATCVNTGPGTFMCSCNEGFTGDGRTCEKLPAPAPACKKMDIMFVLDRSGSINPDDFEHMRHFLLRIAELLKIGKRDEDGEVIGQGAIVTFSEEGTLRVTLKESQTEGKFVSVVNSMPGPKTGGRTKTHRGLTVANEQVVTPEAGLRMNDAGVEKIFMVITDGKQTKESVKKGYEYVGKAMQVFHNRGYLKVFAVGVGLDDQDARNEVRDMVQFPENAILTENYKELIDTVENIVMKFCPVPPICGSENDDCDKNLASCENTQTGSYNCTCNQGYIGNGKKCIAPYVCGTLRDDCHPYLASCTDRENGNYVCECIEHYIGNGKTCQATKICGTEREDCHEHATCFDTGPASYKCRCNKGYVGDGKMCEVEKICGTPKDDCHEYATCADIAPGEYKCTCKPGYTGNGKTCTVIKICGTPQDDCSEFATCTDTEPGKFTCTCNQGYTGDGRYCAAIKLCGTARDDCSEFATCTDTDPGEFTCDCNPGYSGDGRTCKGVTFKFTKPRYTSGEGVATLPEIVVSAGDITAPVTLRVTASPGTAGEGDFTPKTIDVTFAPGEKGPKSIPINIIDDDVVEPTEEFTISMSSSSPGVTVGGPATVVIEDNDKPAPCKPKTDLIFVLDRSGSIRKEDYDMMREFVNKIAKELKVGERNEKGEIIGQAAIVTFSEKGEKRITLAQSQDKDKFYDIVARMPGPLLGGRTKTHRALAIADKELAIKEAGYREDDPEVKKMIMVITDGEQTKESVRKGYIYVGEAMKPFFARNMDVFAIGVGLDNQGAIDEVRDMVEVPENAILASNFTDLVHRVESIIKKFCPDLKICGTPQDDCSQFATCADTEPGEYSCTCNQGYTGDGKTCTRIYLCGTPQDDCSEFATCADTQPGEYSCTCNQGYSGDGRTCKGVTFKFTKPRYTSGEAVATLPEIVVSAGDITAPVTLSVTASPGTAGEGDFSPKMIDVTFAPGEKGPKLIPIGIIDDDVVEPTEEFTVSMSSSSPGVTVGGPATVVIEDNDKIPAPVLFDLTPESPTTISAAWRPPPELENVVDYSVCYTDLSNGEEKCKTVKPTTPDGPVHFEFTDMNEDTTYQVSVRARDVAGVLGPVSNIMNVKTPATDPVDACDKKTDTIFVVDRSSISESGYNNIRSFILNVARRLRVGVKNERKEIIGQGAVVTFSDEGKKIVTLKDSKYPGRFVKAVRSMPGPLSDATRAGKIHRGLEIAYREVAVANEGLRVRDDSVHKTVVVITNGHQTEEKNGYVYVGDAVKPFFKRGIDVIAIGIDLETGKAKDQLKDMVRIPQNAFLVNHHSNLSSAMNRIVSRVCPKTKICGSPRDDCHRFATCFDTAPGEYKCICRDGYIGDGKECAEKTCNLDIGFLIDSSASMRDCNYEKEKKLVKHIAEQMLVGTNKSRASIVLFSDTAAMYKKFNAVEELKEFNMLVNELPMVGGATHLDKALELAASQMFTTANGMRDNTVPKLLFVLTDGAQSAISMSKPLQEIASSLHERNIRVIVIGAGEADEQQLSPLVQANADLLMVKRFEDATDALTLFAENMCSVGRCSHMEMVVPVRIDGCVSPHPVKIGTCMGKCVTGPNFRLADGIFKMDCQTCRPKGFALKEVTLTCPGNRKRRFEIREATSCMCEKCPWKKRLL